MIRSMSKKKFSLLFVVVTMVWCGQMSPMKKRCIEPIDKKTIKNLSYDSLCNIFQFCSAENKEKTAADKVAELRLVSKEFKHVVENYPCYFARINEKPDFLPYRLEYTDSDHIPFWGKDAILDVLLLNEKSVEKFVNEPFFCNVKDKSFQINMKLSDKELVKCLKPHLQNLLSRLKANKKKLVSLSIGCPSASEYIEFYYEDEAIKPKRTLSLCPPKGKLVSNEELNLFDGIKTLYLTNCKFENPRIEWPKGIQKVSFFDYKDFDFECFKNFDDTQLESLKSISVVDCKKVNLKGLEKLKNLRKLKLWLDKTKELKATKALKNIEELFIDLDNNEKVMETVCKLFKRGVIDREAEHKIREAFPGVIISRGPEARNLEKLRKLTISFKNGDIQDLYKKFDESTKNLGENGCQINFHSSL